MCVGLIRRKALLFQDDQPLVVLDTRKCYFRLKAVFLEGKSEVVVVVQRKVFTEADL